MRPSIACLAVVLAVAAPSAAIAAPNAEVVGASASSELSPKVAKKLFKARIRTLAGTRSSLGAHKGKALLLVNVASKCGLTPQYTQLEALQKKYGKRGFTVVGFPCNQFGGQEPGTAAEIQTFCSETYGVTFPMFEKVDVNGKKRHPIFRALTSFPDQKGEAGDVQWNFEKFVISADRKRIWRFRPRTKPDDPSVIGAIEAALPK